VIYGGKISPDFYGWVFPHGQQASVGMVSMIKSVDVKRATAGLRAASGMTYCKTIHKENVPIPLKPLDCWDNGKDVVLARGMLLAWWHRHRGRASTMRWAADALRRRQQQPPWRRDA
jgi:hypothetical protein